MFMCQTELHCSAKEEKSHERIFLHVLPTIPPRHLLCNIKQMRCTSFVSLTMQFEVRLIRSGSEYLNNVLSKKKKQNNNELVNCYL